MGARFFRRQNLAPKIWLAGLKPGAYIRPLQRGADDLVYAALNFRDALRGVHRVQPA